VPSKGVTTPTRGLSAFLVEADQPSVRLTRTNPSWGLHGFSSGEITFNSRIPVTSRLGAEGDGLDVAYSSSVLHGRPNQAAVALGIHQAILDTIVAYTVTAIPDRPADGDAAARLHRVPA